MDASALPYPFLFHLSRIHGQVDTNNGSSGGGGVVLLVSGKQLDAAAATLQTQLVNAFADAAAAGEMGVASFAFATALSGMEHNWLGSR